MRNAKLQDKSIEELQEELFSLKIINLSLLFGCFTLIVFSLYGLIFNIYYTDNEMLLIEGVFLGGFSLFVSKRYANKVKSELKSRSFQYS